MLGLAGFHRDRHVGVPGDIRHVDTTKSVLVNLVFGPSDSPLLERYPAFEPCKGGTKTGVDPVAESERHAWSPVDIETIGLIEFALVSRGGAGQQKHWDVSGDRYPVELTFADREPALVLRGW